MTYKGIPEEQLKPEKERALALAMAENEATLDLLKSFHDVTIYGLLLAAELPEHPLSQLLRERWSEIHHLTGPKFLLVAFQPPAEWQESIKDYWKQQQGESFEKTWQTWQKGLDRGVAYDYLKLFTPELKPSQLPCLVLFTDLKERKAVVRSIPDWDTDSLYRLLTVMIEAINECCEKPDEERLECLRSSLTSPSVILKDHLGQLERQMSSYLRDHPSEVVITAVSIVLALGTGGILPLGAGAIEVLKVIKDIFSKHGI